MSKGVITADFDYSQLDEDTASKLEYFANAGRSLIRKNMIRFIADFGEVLSGARQALANHGNGTFVKWATTEFDLTKQTIYNYVNAWDKCLSNGWTNPDNLSVSALYLLSSENTSSSVRAKAKRLTASRSAVTKADIERLIQDESPPAAESQCQNPPMAGDGAKPQQKPTVTDQKSVGPQRGPATTARVQAQSQQAATEVAEVGTGVPATKNGSSREAVSAASLVDQLTRSHVGHIARGLTCIAEANGGEGEQFRSADAGLNQMILALQKMREGEQ